MGDPLDVLREPIRPVEPREEFAGDLRRRLAVWIREADQPPAVPRIVPVLYVHDAQSAIRFYVQTFGAEPSSEPVTVPDGRVHHAELRVGPAEFVVADEFPELGLLGPRSRGGASSALILHVVDADLTWRRAIAAGAEQLRPVADRFGLRAGWLVDPFGHRWEIASRA